jgi:hypothetical protein
MDISARRVSCISSNRDVESVSVQDENIGNIPKKQSK